MSKPRMRALGRGLEALIPLAPGGSKAGAPGIPEYVSLDQVRPSSEQMRKRFDAEPLRELADSIRTHGLLQPILVRPMADGYELIAGERRWRAARMAGLERIPAIVRRGTAEDDSLLLGLIENLQREDLDPIEEARGIRRLIDHFGLTHEEAGARLGKHRVAISQALRLLSGCPALVSATAAGAISAGHARALVGLSSVEAQEQGLKVVLARQLSVRQTERWVRGFQPPAIRRRVDEPPADLVLAEFRERLAQRYGGRCTVQGTLARGQLSLRYSSPAELKQLVVSLLGTS